LTWRCYRILCMFFIIHVLFIILLNIQLLLPSGLPAEVAISYRKNRFHVEGGEFPDKNEEGGSKMHYILFYARNNLISVELL
jgi:hypothetical protein